MNSAQWHLALTHVPVIVSFVGLVMLVIALFRKNVLLTNTSYVLLIVAAVAALPVFFTGEGAEEAVEHAPGISESLVERHENVAKTALIAIMASGFFAIGVMLLWRWHTATKLLRVMVLVLAITSAALMAETAHLGGQIRHSAASNAMAAGAEGENHVAIESNEDDD
jgi:uncharacterized membrane protein